MEELRTKYGLLQGISTVEYHSSGAVKSCILNQPNELITPYGTFIPQYTNDGDRRKYRNSLSFHENGVIKSIALENQSNVETRFGTFPAELITFYETGILKRLFPLNGKITGFWTEENEYDLAPLFEFKFSFAEFQNKVINLHFYETGRIKSLTLWPKEKVEVTTSVGKIVTRTGFSLYPNGALKSIEPQTPLPVDTPIGTIKAFDLTAIGIHADQNSLTFYEDGRLKSLTTSSHLIEILSSEGVTTLIKPSLAPNMFNPELMSLRPYTLQFLEDGFTVNGDSFYSYENNTFNVQPFSFKMGEGCTDCSSCSACS